MKKMIAKVVEGITDYKKKVISFVRKPKFEGRLNNAKDRTSLTAIHMRDEKGAVRAIMDVEREELYIVPPGKDRKRTHRLYSRVCNEDSVEFIDHCEDFSIAVPMSFYIKMAQEFNLHDRYKEAMEFREAVLKSWVKWKEENRE